MTSPAVEASLLRAEFTSAFERVWEVQVGIDLSVSPRAHPVLRAEPWVVGVVWIGGSWTGSVSIAVPRSFACELAGRMLEIDSDAVTKAEYQDTVRELANMAAGNLKSALPSPSGLATPGCSEISDLNGLHSPFDTVISINYQSGAYPLVAELRALD